MNDDTPRAALTRDQRDDAKADEWIRKHRHSPLPDASTPNFNELNTENVDSVANARQSSGASTLIEESVWFDDWPEIADNETDLLPQERHVLRMQLRDGDTARALNQHVGLRLFVEAYFQAATLEELRGLITRGIHLIRRYRARDIQAVIATVISEALRRVGCSDQQRRERLRDALGGGVSTIYAMLKHGEQRLADMVKEAKGAANSDVPRAEARPVPKCVKPSLRCARGTEFDSSARLRAVAEMSPAQQAVFVRILERRAITDEIDAVAKGDRKTRTRMLPHSFNEVLDALGRSDNRTRRMLAKLPPDDASALVADWMSEMIDKAIGGTPEERRVAREKYDAQRYHDTVRAFIKQNVKREGVAHA